MNDLLVRAGKLIAELNEIMSRCDHCREYNEVRSRGLEQREYDSIWRWELENKSRCVA